MELIHPKTNEDFGYLECEISAKSKDLDDYLSTLVKDSLEENISIDAQLNGDLWVEGDIWLDVDGLEINNIDLMKDLFQYIKSRNDKLNGVSFDDYYNSKHRTMTISVNLNVRVNLVIRKLKLEGYFSIDSGDGDEDFDIVTNKRVDFAYFSDKEVRGNLEKIGEIPRSHLIEDHTLQQRLKDAANDFFKKEEIKMIVKHYSN